MLTCSLESLEKAVASCVNIFMVRNMKFTAYDVTVTVRNRIMPNVYISHYEVREIVHNLMSKQKNYVGKQSNKYPAIEYGPVVHQIKNKEATKLNLSQAAGTWRQKNNTLVTRRVPDNRGSLTLPANLVRQIKARPGDQVCVITSKYKKALVVYPVKASSKGETKYTVNNSGNVRITKKHLAKIGKHDAYNIEVRDGKILVE